ncbi:MAG: carboxy terminal-processing peptidase [Pseudomonadota bacterium]
MKHLKITSISLFAFLFTLLSFIHTASASDKTNQSNDVKIYKASDYYHPVTPEDNHSRLSFIIAKRLQYQHYLGIVLNDALSAKVFDAYLKALDPSRSIFTQKEIKQFSKFRLYIDDAYRRGQLSPAFLIYNQFQQSLAQRLAYMLNRINHDYGKINLTLDEQLETDREEAKWAINHNELEDLWRRQLKDTIISMKLNDKDNKEIKKTLNKRFSNQLNRLKQTKSEDAFRIYINALAESYDPHTQYFSPRISENFNIQMKLSLEGIGAMLQEEDGYTKIKRLVPGGPAQKAGQLKSGDRIVAVGQDDKKLVDVIGWRLDDVVQLIRGEKGTTVRLSIIPHNESDEHNTRIVSIIRNTVKLEEQSAKKDIITIERKDKNYKIGIIDLPTFYVDFKGAQNNIADYRSTTRDVKKLLQQLKKEKIDGLVIDLRNNGGGSLQEVNTLLGLFIKSGPTVLIQNSDHQVNSLNDKSNSIVYDGPLVVLVNRLSASASEIFAGAIQDYKRGIVVGTQTFGKGTVQALQPLAHGQLKLTHAKFYRVSGDSTQNLGVIPDILLPAIYDKEEIGESSLPEALKWDQIDSSKYNTYPDMSPYFAALKKKHLQRIKINPDFIFLDKSIKRLNELKDKTNVSLNEKLRRKEFDNTRNSLLQIENERRIAKGKKAYESVEAMKKAQKEEFEANEDKPAYQHKSDEVKAYLKESAHILVDFIYQNNN